MLKNKKCKVLFVAASVAMNLGVMVNDGYCSSSNLIANLQENFRRLHWARINYRPQRTLTIPMLPVPLVQSPSWLFDCPKIEKSDERKLVKKQSKIPDNVYFPYEYNVITYVVDAITDMVNCSIMLLNNEVVPEHENAFWLITQDQFRIMNTVRANQSKKCETELNLIHKLLKLVLNNNYPDTIKNMGIYLCS